MVPVSSHLCSNNEQEKKQRDEYGISQERVVAEGTSLLYLAHDTKQVTASL